MAQQITNNSLILDSLSTNTNFADTSANQFDNILDIANKSVLKQNAVTTIKDNSAATNNSNVNIVSGTAQTVSKSANTTSNNTTNNGININDNKADKGTTLNTTDSTVNNESVKSFESVDSRVDNTNDSTQTTQVVDAESQTVSNLSDKVEDTTVQDTEIDDSTISEDITGQVETLIQTYAMNKLDLSTLKLHLPEDIEISDSDLDSVIDDAVLDIDVDTDINTDELESDVTVDTDTTVDSDSNDTINEPIEIKPVNINLIQEVSANMVSNPISVNDNNLTLKVSSEVKALEETSYFLPKEKPVNDVLTQDIIDELNVTIEDVDLSSETQTDELLADSPLMDSTEQVVKYSMEKADDSMQPKDADSKDTDSLLNIRKIDSENVDIVEEDMAKVDVEGLEDLKKDIIKSSDKEIDIESNVDDTEEIVSEDVDYSFSEDGFESESELETSNKQVSSKPVKQTLAKEYSEVEVSAEDSAILDETVSNNTISGVGHVGGSNSVHTVHAATTTTAASQTFASANISKDDVIAQIHAKLQSMNAHTNTKLTMVLNPESLGKVTIQLANTKSGMVAEMVVASQAVKEVLDTNLSSLKDTLTAQGVQVNEVSVKVSESENNAEMDYTEQEGSDSNRGEQGKQQRQQGKDEKEFEQMVSDFEEKNKN